MTTQQMILLSVLVGTLIMFVWGRWRYDMVAVGALLICVFSKLVPASSAFSGFGHPAVVTVACVLILSHGLLASGAVDVLTRHVLPAQAGPTLTIAMLTGIAALLSGFMNNVGALALLMPVAIQIARRQNVPAGRVLMPLAFGSILGGMTTLIGTPPNLIVSSFRAQNGAGSFAMFDYTPVGLAVAASGVIFVAIVGWRLVPVRKQSVTEGFDIGAYLTEVRVEENSKAAGMTLREIDAELQESGGQVVSLVRNDVHLTPPSYRRFVRTGDVLVIEAQAETLGEVLSKLGLKLEEAENVKEKKETEDNTRTEKQANAEGSDEDKKSSPSDEIVLSEFAVLPGSPLVGRSATDILLRTRYGINLLAVSRQGYRSISRLRSMALRAGDVLLMQGPLEVLSEFAGTSGCVPLAERFLRIPDKRKAFTASIIMAAAITGAAFGLLPAAISFAAGALALMVFRTVSLRAVYETVDWPVIVLLGALIPVAQAMESTGGAELVARLILKNVAQGQAIIALIVIMVITMTLSDVMNNAATAAVMCPIAIGMANQLGANADTFLMAVAIGASCAFLTPIGHQNNTLILGPGGFRFGDYWRLGLPLEILALAVSIPMLLLVWPL
ncbi:MAG: SLC13 family permease [Syntrophorhabdus sp.]